MSTITLKRRWLYLPVMAGLLATVSFAIFYLLQSRDALLRWFFSLNDCFYRRDNFVEHVFTPAVKSAGNGWCVLAALAAAALFCFLLVTCRRDRETYVFAPPALLSRKAIPYWALLVAGTSLWLYANQYFLPGTDEIFSAVHCSALHPLQCLSYYMSPNNHLLFNVTNALCPSAVTDKIVSGRLLSLLAYVALICWVYHWLRQEAMPVPLAFLCALVAAVQVPVWGFGAQARGYEWCALASWFSLIALHRYFFRGGSKRSLLLATAAISAGYMVIPTFLYTGVTLIVFAIAVQLHRRRLDLRYWKYTVVGLLLVCCFYLPVISFSGLATFTENKYVVASEGTMADFLTAFHQTFRYCFDCGFFSTLHDSYWRAYLLLLFPLLLLLRKRWRSYGLLYLLLWGVYLAMVLVMKRYTYSRNLTGHFSITLSLILLCFYAFIVDARRLGKPVWRRALYGACLLGAIVYDTTGFKEAARFALYSADNNETYTSDEAALQVIPPGSTVALSDANFMFCYMLRRKGYPVSRCDMAGAQYIILHDEERFPQALRPDYDSIARHNEFTFYHVKRAPGLLHE